MHLQYQKLCNTCINEPTCSRYKEFDKPIVYCERYESDPLSPIPENFQIELKGLCCTCYNRYICVLINAEGGVWHCNEYQ